VVESVYSAVRTDSLYKSDYVSSVKVNVIFDGVGSDHTLKGNRNSNLFQW
jgi:hypothetical protein